MAIGTIYDSGESAFVSGDIAVTGSGITINAGNIRMVSGSVNFNRYCQLTPVTPFDFEDHNLERWTQWVKISFDTQTSTSYGIGVGVKGGGFLAWSTVGQYGLASAADPNNNKALWYYTGGGTNPFSTWQIADTAPIYTALINTDYWIRTERDGETLKLSLYAADRTTVVSTEYSRIPNSADNDIPSGEIGSAWANWHYHKVGKFCLWNFGSGAVTLIKRWIIEVNDGDNTNDNPEYLVLGDSNTTPEKARKNDRYVQALIDTTPKVQTDFTVWAGGSNELAEIQSTMPAIATLNATNIIVNVGSNDVQQDGTAAAEAALEALLDDLRVTTGARIIVCTPIARNGIDFTSYNSKVQAEATEWGYDVVDLYGAKIGRAHV